MTLTGLQRTLFFTSRNQMALPAAHRTVLAAEGLVNEADFIYFKEDELKITFKNMRYGLLGVN